MARRRMRRKRGGQAAKRIGTIARLRRRTVAALAAVLDLRWAHGSIFGIGIVLGLGVGLALGLGLAWLDGRRATPEREPTVADVTPEEAPEEAPEIPAVAPIYSERTEPVPEAEPEPAVVPSAPMPPMIAEAPPFTPAPQAAEPTPQAEPAPPTPSEPTPGVTPAWLANAVASIDPGDRPAIAIVLDDVGAAPAEVAGALELPAPVTLSIMTYASNAPRIAREARAAGHEVMVHVPMEPISRDADPGPNALLVGLAPEEIERRLDWGLAQFDGYVGINNHMGSKFTQNEAGMRVVLEMLKARGLLFLDSRTIASSVGDRLAGEIGVTHVQRDVFLDDVIDPADILRELEKTEAVAAKHGVAIAIGHPHPDTIEALREWIPEAKRKGFVLVPLTTIAKKQSGVTG